MLNDAEAETPILWPPDAKNWLIGKDPDAGKEWKQEEKGTTEDKTVGWHHPLYGYEFEQALGVGSGQGSLACCSPWVTKSRTWLSNWTELKVKVERASESLYTSCTLTEDLLWSLPYTMITDFDGNDLGTLYFHQQALNAFLWVLTLFQWLLVIRNSHLPSQ